MDAAGAGLHDRVDDARAGEFFDAHLLRGTPWRSIVRDAARHIGCRIECGLIDGFAEVAAPDDDVAVGPAMQETDPEIEHVQHGVRVVMRGSAAEGPVATAFVQRLAVAVAVAAGWEARRALDAETSLSALDLVISPVISEDERAAALRRLRVGAEERVRIVVADGPPASVDRLVRALAEHHAVRASGAVGPRRLIVVGSGDHEELSLPGVPTGVRAAYSRVTTASRAHDAYAVASRAMKFALPSPHDTGPYHFSGTWVNAENLGALEALTFLHRDHIDVVPDMAVLDVLAAQHGDAMLHVLEAYASSTSMRQAASLMHMHHNTVSYWVRKAESALGYSFAQPYRRFRLLLALCLYRVRAHAD